jgi:hypothetical protein
LEQDDVPEVLEGDRTEVLGKMLGSEWRRELDSATRKTKAGKKALPSFGKALFRVFFWKQLYYFTLCFGSECVLR